MPCILPAWKSYEAGVDELGIGEDSPKKQETDVVVCHNQNVAISDAVLDVFSQNEQHIVQVREDYGVCDCCVRDYSLKRDVF